jgi:hypothetical protein
MMIESKYDHAFNLTLECIRLDSFQEEHGVPFHKYLMDHSVHYIHKCRRCNHETEIHFMLMDALYAFRVMQTFTRCPICNYRDFLYPISTYYKWYPQSFARHACQSIDFFKLFRGETIAIDSMSYWITIPCNPETNTRNVINHIMEIQSRKNSHIKRRK